jgi:DnaK suppressor protein
VKATAKKTATKSAAKPSSKSSAKPAVKKAAKPAPKAASKPAAKPAAKNAKPAAKSSKPVAKKSAKPVAKPVAKKAAAKPAKAPVKPAKATKPAAKTGVKAPSKTPVKVPAKSAKVVLAKPSAKASAKPEPKAVAKPIAQIPTKAAASPAPAPTKTKGPAAAAPASIPAPAQASAAAKASYHMIASAPVLTPPPPVAVKRDPKLANNWKTKTAEQLNDAEVIAMPDSEYMNDKQMAFFRLKLVQLKLDILNSADQTTEHLREDTVVVPDPADRATIEEEHALELRTRDRERKLLKKIEQSIGRIDAGDYGYCDETGEPIGVGRLLARPTATLSLEAQQRRELKQKMFGD